jgi:hypothetical protein
LFAIEPESEQQTRGKKLVTAKAAKKNFPALAEDARAGLPAKGWYT